jgi:hypothetical protein
MKMAVFWDVEPCSLVDIDHRFRRAYCLHNHTDDGKYLPEYTAQYPINTLMIEAVRSSQKSVSIYQITLRNIPEDNHLHTRRENLKSHILFSF